ncbi:Hydrophobic protein LTI6B [Linum perenne]
MSAADKTPRPWSPPVTLQWVHPGGAIMGAATCVDIILAILLPPLGVFLKFGCGVEFWICLLLTILGYIPGIIYAIYAITK